MAVDVGDGCGSAGVGDGNFAVDHEALGLPYARAVHKHSTFGQRKLLCALCPNLFFHVEYAVFKHQVGDVDQGIELVRGDLVHAVSQALRFGLGTLLGNPLRSELTGALRNLDAAKAGLANAGQGANRTQFGRSLDDLADHLKRGKVAALGVGADVQGLVFVPHIIEGLLLIGRESRRDVAVAHGTDPVVRADCLFFRRFQRTGGALQHGFDLVKTLVDLKQGLRCFFGLSQLGVDRFVTVEEALDLLQLVLGQWVGLLLLD